MILVLSEGYTPHITHNRYIAQSLKSEFGPETRVITRGGDYTLMDLKNAPSSTETLEFNLGAFTFAIYIQQWPFFASKMDNWKEKAKKKGRGYHKIYGAKNILCITNKDFELLENIVKNGYEDFQQTYSKWCGKF